MNRVVHFEIHADDVDRASTFYSNVFGWSIKKWEGDFEYSIVMTAEQDSEEHGIDGGITKRSMNTPPLECG
jgi:predicted enzyme related to lactoylglutathione lyase